MPLETSCRWHIHTYLPGMIHALIRRLTLSFDLQHSSAAGTSATTDKLARFYDPTCLSLLRSGFPFFSSGGHPHTNRGHSTHTRYYYDTHACHAASACSLSLYLQCSSSRRPELDVFLDLYDVPGRAQRRNTGGGQLPTIKGRCGENPKKK